ncbi:helix-turn-helix domain-containing protein [Streptomyces scabiei]|uniref:helix-turn-helix domain-containing protein n=1 Tax=Streptomyces scabiei TaxID=1930 RepID=UPI0029AE4524|nr:helix-turn-helix domain-containing protein [Streptomyces scabiei]MDX3516367.1 helix-turn-helix domain-containing protein [Streptomyces scabiei]
MDTQHPSAPSRARARVADNKHPNRQQPAPRSGGGLIHEHTRHTSRFTVIGNHLAQHPELSLLAIGLGAHIQSLPKGARVDIKTLAGRFTEGTTRIAAALRELEAHGYLRRERERVPGGRIVTRTISCNQPGRGDGHAEDEPVRRPLRKEKAPRKPLPAVPQPGCSSPALLQTATDLLADLRRADPRLLLSACDTAHLAPGVAAWLERDLTPTAVRDALTGDLPNEPLHRPAALLAHRLTAQLPPPPPFRAPTSPPSVHYGMTNCDGCDRGFRGPAGSRCRDCRSSVAGVTLTRAGGGEGQRERPRSHGRVLT